MASSLSAVVHDTPDFRAKSQAGLKITCNQSPCVIVIVDRVRRWVHRESSSGRDTTGDADITGWARSCDVPDASNHAMFISPCSAHQVSGRMQLSLPAKIPIPIHPGHFVLEAPDRDSRASPTCDRHDSAGPDHRQVMFSCCALVPRLTQPLTFFLGLTRNKERCFQPSGSAAGQVGIRGTSTVHVARKITYIWLGPTPNIVRCDIYIQIVLVSSVYSSRKPSQDRLSTTHIKPTRKIRAKS
jgi:hypothetical protein